jgi:hypothetical protein
MHAGIYTDEYARMYSNVNMYELPPHVYAVADLAYRQMRDELIDQVRACTVHVVCVRVDCALALRVPRCLRSLHFSLSLSPHTGVLTHTFRGCFTCALT